MIFMPVCVKSFFEPILTFYLKEVLGTYDFYYELQTVISIANQTVKFRKYVINHTIGTCLMYFAFKKSGLVQELVFALELIY